MILLITNDKFLACAKRIISNPLIPEEDSRSAISRAYYSLYHETLAVTIRKFSLELIRNIERYRRPRRRLNRFERNQLNVLDPAFLRQCNFHLILTRTLLNIGERGLSISFKNFRDKRNEADYNLKLTFNHNDANIIVNNIENLVQQVKSL